MGLAEPPAPSRLRLTAFFRRALVIVLALAIALTAASFGYNLATGGQAARPAGLSMVNAGGHSSGAAVVGLAALRGRHVATGVAFLDGDATPLGAPSWIGWLLINPYRTTMLRLALSSSWLIRKLYSAQCGPACPPLSTAGVQTWRLPLEQPGFESARTYSLRHGIPSMTVAQLAQLRAAPVPKRVIVGVNDPQLTPAAAAAAAAAIGAPAPVTVPGRHLTMISSAQQVAAAIRAFIGSAPKPAGGRAG
jgi:hypothetical protein